MDLQTIELLPLLGCELRKVGAYWIGPCAMCGGKDRFVLKKTPRGDKWLCRKCGDGKYHDAIYFVMKRDHVTHKQALEILGLRVPIAPRLNLPEAKPMELSSVEWQRHAWRVVDRMGDSLALSDQGKAGRDYLASRGLTKDIYICWGLGFGSVFDPIAKAARPAISIPWIVESDNIITGVKYRFIDGAEGTRYACMPGSVLSIFGNQTILSSDTTLLLVEGEINCLSVSQLHVPGLSVISFGSESGNEIPASRAAIFRNLAMKYERVIIWCDEGARSRAYEKILGRSCKKLQSPNTGTSKADANRLLVIGDLPDFISQVLGMAPLNREVKQHTEYCSESLIMPNYRYE